ncbi:MAG: CTP synthetase [Rhodospirillaceae bacterium]|nr:CTP synthetase [Rhodospirillaceae bacterium]
MTRFIFVTGGVVSSLGKGLASASLAALLQARGYSVRLRKFDPYLNVDPGTMSPYQHGEVFVTDDGAETDLDLGHYERFTGVSARQSDNATAGRIYSNVIANERKGEYLGGTVQVIPHVTDEIKRMIMSDTGNVDFLLCEIGGTVGDIESQPFLEAIRQLRNDLGSELTLFLHLTLIPYIASAGELKTKPTQHSVKELRSLGIQADILLCRCTQIIPDSERNKIALFCNVGKDDVIAAVDVNSIYEVPENYHSVGLDSQVLKRFGLGFKSSINVNPWKKINECLRNPDGEVTIAVVGKYTGLRDAYISLSEALTHGGLKNKLKVQIEWLDSEILEDEKNLHLLENVHGILVPGGFGGRGIEGKIAAIQFARERKLPYFGICFGMQLAVLEIARNVAGLENASSTEFGPTPEPVIALLNEWVTEEGNIELRSTGDDLGGTMRLGAYQALIKDKTLLARVYNRTNISERHRHRYEVNPKYESLLNKAGLFFSASSPDGLLPEAVEIPDHPWFVGVQFHPELKSKPFEPHPLFSSFVEAAMKKSRLV